ncbi:MAG: cell division protein SepF [Candidatus Thermoplasmatota archaeon]
MGIVSKLFPRDETNAKDRRAPAASDWIDLSDYSATQNTGEGAASTWVRFAPLKALDDLKHYSTYVYDGSILILDFSAVQNDEILLRRLTNELRKIAQDTGGDLAGLGDHHILLTPAGIKVDRKQLAKPATDEDSSSAQPRTSYSPQAPAPIPAAPTGPAPMGAPGRRVNGTRK